MMLSPAIRMLSENTLSRLVTDKGVYASSALGEAGMYYAFFGRDTAITTYLIAQTEKRTGRPQFGENAVKGLLQLMKWQSKKDNPDTGEETGKFPHEIRTDAKYYLHLTEGFLKQGKRSWYVDPADQVLKNWDTNDSTPLWIIVVSRLHEKKMLTMNTEILSAIRSGLLWCIRNINDHEGFAGYSYNPNRAWSGLINHTWKDSEYSYLHEDGRRPEHPIKDVFVNTLTWAALKYGEKIFGSYDPHFSTLLRKEALDLKKRFNNPKTGFIMKEKGSREYYLAEAIDKNGTKLTGISCDAALSLWAHVDGETVIEQAYIRSIVKRVMMPDMFDPKAGVRTYSARGRAFDPVAYHRGPHTYWPFVSALIADGLFSLGYAYEARRILTGMVRGVTPFDSCIEMFVKNDSGYEKFREPTTGQLSANDQAWTAASLYYASEFLAR